MAWQTLYLKFVTKKWIQEINIVITTSLVYTHLQHVCHWINNSLTAKWLQTGWGGSNKVTNWIRQPERQHAWNHNSIDNKHWTSGHFKSDDHWFSSHPLICGLVTTEQLVWERWSVSGCLTQLTRIWTSNNPWLLAHKFAVWTFWVGKATWMHAGLWRCKSRDYLYSISY